MTVTCTYTSASVKERPMRIIWLTLNLKQFVLFYPSLFFFNPIRVVPLAFGYSEGTSARGQGVKQSHPRSSHTLSLALLVALYSSLFCCDHIRDSPTHNSQILTWPGLSMSTSPRLQDHLSHSALDTSPSPSTICSFSCLFVWLVVWFGLYYRFQHSSNLELQTPSPPSQTCSMPISGLFSFPSPFP